MPLLNIEGRKVRVEDSFLQMSEDEQHAKVDDIAKKLKLTPSGQSPGMVEGVGRAFVRGAPIIGAVASKMNAAIDAGLAPYVDPATPDQKLTGETFGKRYSQAMDIGKGKDEAFHQAHPMVDTAAEIAGGIASTGAVGATAGGAQALGLAGKTLPQMMLQGGISGAAIDAGDAALQGENPLTAGGVGGVVGTVSPVAGRLVNATIGKRVGDVYRGITDPAAEAERRVAGTIDRDIKAGDRGMSLQEMQAAKAEGQPTMLMDAGGESTRALARSAANTSPEGRSELSRTIDARFESQAPRLAEWLQKTFHYPNADAQQEALDQVAKTVNRPAYAKAYKEGDRDIMSPELDRLMGSPALVEAMRKASISGKDRAITQGVGAMRQGVTVENGLVNFTKGPSGVPTYPNLAFWDATKRELDDATNAAMRGGRKEEAGTLKDLTKSLRGELDKLVPSYADARAGAAKFFGADNAIEAGQNFVGASQKFGMPAVRRQLAKMSPNERQLFQDGYVSRLVETIEKTGDRRTVLNKIMQSPAAREEMNTALGPMRAKEVEGRLRIEGIMDLARPAVQGNSTTTRQLVELGLAGGVGGYESYKGDPQALMNAALVYGAARGHRVIDERVARQVAKLLASDNVGQLQRGLRILTRNQNLMGAIRNADAGLAAIAARGAAPTGAKDVGLQ
jgi:hypothetical protein